MTRAGDGFAALAAMVRGWSGPWPSSVRRLLFPGGGGRSGVRRGIGSAVTLLPLLVCCGLLPPLPALPRRTRWAAGTLIVSLASLALLPPAPAEAQTITLSASAITDSSATLTLAGNRVTWWYRRTVPGPAETCSAAQSGGGDDAEPYVPQCKHGVHLQGVFGRRLHHGNRQRDLHHQPRPADGVRSPVPIRHLLHGAPQPSPRKRPLERELQFREE